jgi:hypothetical protein
MLGPEPAPLAPMKNADGWKEGRRRERRREIKKEGSQQGSKERDKRRKEGRKGRGVVLRWRANFDFGSLSSATKLGEEGCIRKEGKKEGRKGIYERKEGRKSIYIYIYVYIYIYI